MVNKVLAFLFALSMCAPDALAHKDDKDAAPSSSKPVFAFIEWMPPYYPNYINVDKIVSISFEQSLDAYFVAIQATANGFGGGFVPREYFERNVRPYIDLKGK
jgi:hypothetical protein